MLRQFVAAVEGNSNRTRQNNHIELGGPLDAIARARMARLEIASRSVTQMARECQIVFREEFMERVSAAAGTVRAVGFWL